MNKKRLIIAWLIWSTILLVFIVSWASSPEPPREWFNTGLELDDHDFPDEVKFSVVRHESEECLRYTDSIVVSNSSSTPLHFEAKSLWRESLEEKDKPCPDDNLCLKVVSNQSWKWDVTNLYDDSPLEFDWVLIDDYGESKPLEFWPRYNGLGVSHYHIPLFESLNREGYGGDRPEDIVAPDSQYFELPYIYDNEEFNIGITLSYSINECYPSKAPKGLITSSSALPLCILSIIIIGIFLVSFVLLILGKVLKSIERGSNKQQSKSSDQ